MGHKFYIEIDCIQKNHEGERICGDVFLSERIKSDERTIVVLSDGMGHGVKANMLAILTSTMALNFTKEHKDVNRIADIIMNTLPVCSKRHISYSTFTIIDIEADGQTTILEYDNPETLIIRDNQIFNPGWQCVILDSEKNAGKVLKNCTFYAQKEDRIIFCSDGITQSGMGSEKFAFGWGHENLENFTKRLIYNDPQISANKLAGKVVNMAYQNDGYMAKDDASCAAIYFRDPRKLLICTGPPYEEERDKKLADVVRNFQGKKVLCGATTADIIARELELQIEDSFEFHDPDLPPIAYMTGIDLVTEGILTLSKVSNILKVYNNNYMLGKGPADQIVKLLKESDEIQFVIGTRINIAHQDPNLPIELEIRRTVVRRIAETLENKFLKEVSMKFI